MVNERLTDASAVRVIKNKCIDSVHFGLKRLKWFLKY